VKFKALTESMAFWFTANQMPMGKYFGRAQLKNKHKNASHKSNLFFNFAPSYASSPEQSNQN
jgi:hypothetical protein